MNEFPKTFRHSAAGVRRMRYHGRNEVIFLRIGPGCLFVRTAFPRKDRQRHRAGHPGKSHSGRGPDRGTQRRNRAPQSLWPARGGSSRRSDDRRHDLRLRFTHQSHCHHVVGHEIVRRRQIALGRSRHRLSAGIPRGQKRDHGPKSDDAFFRNAAGSRSGAGMERLPDGNPHGAHR